MGFQVLTVALSVPSNVLLIHSMLVVATSGSYTNVNNTQLFLSASVSTTQFLVTPPTRSVCTASLPGAEQVGAAVLL